MIRRADRRRTLLAAVRERVGFAVGTGEFERGSITATAGAPDRRGCVLSGVLPDRTVGGRRRWCPAIDPRRG